MVSGDQAQNVMTLETGMERHVALFSRTVMSLASAPIWVSRVSRRRRRRGMLDGPRQPSMLGALSEKAHIRIPQPGCSETQASELQGALV